MIFKHFHRRIRERLLKNSSSFFYYLQSRWVAQSSTVWLLDSVALIVKLLNGELFSFSWQKDWVSQQFSIVWLYCIGSYKVENSGWLPSPRIQAIMDHAPNLKHLYFDARWSWILGAYYPEVARIRVTKITATLQLEVLDLGMSFYVRHIVSPAPDFGMIISKPRWWGSTPGNSIRRITGNLSVIFGVGQSH